MKRSAVREFLKVTAQPEMISFAGGLPAPELFPLEQIREATGAVLHRDGARALQYGETEGLAGLRDWIAQRFSRPDRPLSRSNILIVSGAQQGLDLIGRVFLEPGDAALIENPTYLALLSAWRPNGVEFIALPGDADGIRPDKLARSRLLDSLRSGPSPALKPKLLYTIPNFQNPTGICLARDRRRPLVEWARHHDVGIVEDDAYSELRYEDETLPSLAELDAAMTNPDGRGQASGPEKDKGGNVLTVGTFSKVLAPGLRVGWIIGPLAVVEKLVQAKQAMDLHTGSLSQHIILELLQRGELERQIPRLRASYRERRDRMLAALDRYLTPDRGVSWTRPAGGMFLMVTLPAGQSATALLPAALQQNVAFVPGAEFHLDGNGDRTLRLNFSNPSVERIEEGIRRLAGLINEGLTSVRAR
jgi:2-aminoadipate transaminase